MQYLIAITSRPINQGDPSWSINAAGYVMSLVVGRGWMSLCLHPSLTSMWAGAGMPARAHATRNAPTHYSIVLPELWHAAVQRIGARPDPRSKECTLSRITVQLPLHSLQYSWKYGYGVMDADEMVRTAQGWTNLGPRLLYSSSMVGRHAIADSQAVITQLTVGPGDTDSMFIDSLAVSARVSPLFGYSARGNWCDLNLCR